MQTMESQYESGFTKLEIHVLKVFNKFILETIGLVIGSTAHQTSLDCPYASLPHHMGLIECRSGVVEGSRPCSPGTALSQGCHTPFSIKVWPPFAGAASCFTACASL